MTTEPPRPIEEAPEPTIIDPLLPPLAVPELNTRQPLEPDTPELLLWITTPPLLVCVPSPDPTTTAPPVFTVLRPAARLIPPPEPLVPLPALTTTPPPRPAVLAPLPTQMAPELPPLLDPELNTRRPLLPETPPFADIT